MRIESRARARRTLLRRLIRERSLASQRDVVKALGRHGHHVTQATASRDLAALGAAKVNGPEGRQRYVLARHHDPSIPGELVGLLRQFVRRVEHSGNLALLKTEPGAAGTVASALDHAPPEGMLGTLAGDDTVLVVARSATGGAPMAKKLAKLMEGSR